MGKFQATVQCGGPFPSASSCGDVIGGMKVGMNTETFGPTNPESGPHPTVGLPAIMKSCESLKSSSLMLNLIDCTVADARCVMKILSSGAVETTSVC